MPWGTGLLVSLDVHMPEVHEINLCSLICKNVNWIELAQDRVQVGLFEHNNETP